MVTRLHDATGSVVPRKRQFLITRTSDAISTRLRPNKASVNQLW